MNTNISLDHKTCGQLLKLKLSDNAITAYIALKSLYNKQMEQQLLSIQSIIYQLDKDILNKKKNNYKSIFKSFEDGIEELAKAEIIEIINRNKDFYEINMQNLFVEDVTKQIDENGGNKRNVSYFTTFDKRILSNLYRDNRRKEIFRFLFYYLSSKHDNNEYFYFMKTREEMANDINLDIRTIDKYIELLEEYEIIYVFRHSYKWNNSNKQLPNLYGLSVDESDIERFGYTYIRENKNDIYESAIPKFDKDNKSVQPIQSNIKEINKTPAWEDYKTLDEQINKKKKEDLFNNNNYFSNTPRVIVKSNDPYESAIPKFDKDNKSVQPIQSNIKEINKTPIKEVPYVIDLEGIKKLEEQINKKKKQDLFKDDDIIDNYFS